MSTSSSVWDSPGARTSRPPWADYVDAAERAQQALHAHGFIPRRVDTKEFYNKAWVPWHHDRGSDPGKQRRVTDRLKASGMFEIFPSGGKTWLANCELKAMTARPKLRIVT